MRSEYFVQRRRSYTGLGHNRNYRFQKRRKRGEKKETCFYRRLWQFSGTAYQPHGNRKRCQLYGHRKHLWRQIARGLFAGRLKIGKSHRKYSQEKRNADDTGFFSGKNPENFVPDKRLGGKLQNPKDKNFSGQPAFHQSHRGLQKLLQLV